MNQEEFEQHVHNAHQGSGMLVYNILDELNSRLNEKWYIANLNYNFNVSGATNESIVMEGYTSYYDPKRNRSDS